MMNFSSRFRWEKRKRPVPISVGLWRELWTLTSLSQWMWDGALIGLRPIREVQRRKSRVQRLFCHIFGLKDPTDEILKTDFSLDSVL
jgi:hypothetical protein